MMLRSSKGAIGPGERARGDRKRHRNHRRQRAHADHGADPEQRNIAQSCRGAGRLRDREYQKRRRTRHAVHQADQQRAPAETMIMRMRCAGMRRALAGMAMGVEVHGAVVMAVLVKMHAVAPQPPQHMGAEADQHHADGGLHRLGNAIRDRMAEQDGDSRKDEQRERMAETPGQPVLDDVGHMAAARCDAGDGGDMIGFERMLHAQQKPQPKNSEHTPPARCISPSNTSWKPLSGQDFIGQAFHRRKRAYLARAVIGVAGLHESPNASK
jgi:hypothetical protein